MTPRIQALVIEDDAIDFRSLERLCREHSEFHLTWAGTVAEGLDKLEQLSVDVILLDLTLPDSTGLESISRLKETTLCPIVVLTGFDNKQTALEAVKNGAQDYLIKGQFEIELLIKSISYAIERNRLLHELDASRQAAIRAREARRLESATPSRQASASADLNGKVPLKDGNPALFKYAVGQYSEILDRALDQRKYKIEYDVTARLGLLAEQLGAYKAIPRDIVELHTTVLAFKTNDMVPGKVKIYYEEGRYLLTGLIGYLCSFYRSHSSKLPPALPVDELIDSVAEITMREC